MLTDWQILRLYCCQRDENGLPIRKRESPPSYEEVFKHWWRKRGLSEDDLNKKWATFREKSKQEDAKRREWRRAGKTQEEIEVLWEQFLRS